jgi:muconate cycloisomerase
MTIIDDITIERLAVPLRPEWIIACGRYTHSQSPFLLVRLRSDGVEGLGEISGTYEWSGEGFATAEAAVREVLIPALIGQSLCPLALSSLMNQKLAGFSFSKAGIEMAAWDALGKQLGAPIHRLLGGPTRTAVPSKFSVSAAGPEETADIAEAARDAGFRYFKIKVGTGVEQDVARIAAVRARLGAHARIAVDANGAWSLSEARQALRPLLDLGVLAIEQPIAGPLGQLAALRAQSSAPILLDESVWSPADIAAAAEARAADAVSIYVGKFGGISGALHGLTVAHACGLDSTTGSNLELGVGHAAILHTLAATQGVDLETYPPDLAGPAYYVGDLVEPGFEIDDGKVAVPTGPGLGVTLNEQIVRKYVVR